MRITNLFSILISSAAFSTLCYGTTFENLLNGRGIPANSARPDGLIPPWINLSLARKGQSFMSEYFVGTWAGCICGLLTTGVPDAIEILGFTTMSDTKDDVGKRYIATNGQVLVWIQDLFGSVPPSGDTDIMISLKKVRQLHIAAANAARTQKGKAGVVLPADKYANYTLTSVLRGEVFEDMEEGITNPKLKVLPPTSWTNFSQIPFNQQVAALTLYAFMAYPVLFPDKLGITDYDPQDLEGFIHLWAVIGWAMGVDDEYNICLQPDVAATKSLLLEIYENINVPSFFHLDRNSKVLGELTMMGVAQILPIEFLTPNLIMYMGLTRFIQIPAPRVYAELTLAERATYEELETFYYPLYSENPILRAAYNKAAYDGFIARGTEVFGWNFTTRENRAKYVYHAKYEL